ncbi:MAG: hypothetical protein P9L89_02930, partial [Candidatus Celaenobacter polaris]|nr:hypothetical protein [Candidatus Celaenobacter polaris]
MNLSYSIDNSIPKQGFGNEEPTSGLGMRNYMVFGTRELLPPPKKNKKCSCSKTTKNVLVPKPPFGNTLHSISDEIK